MIFHLVVKGVAGVVQNPPGLAPLPADPPIGGPVWTIVVPAILLVGSFLATYLLYRRFAREEQGEPGEAGG